MSAPTSTVEETITLSPESTTSPPTSPPPPYPPPPASLTTQTNGSSKRTPRTKSEDYGSPAEGQGGQPSTQARLCAHGKSVCPYPTRHPARLTTPHFIRPPWVVKASIYWTSISAIIGHPLLSIYARYLRPVFMLVVLPTIIAMHNYCPAQQLLHRPSPFIGPQQMSTIEREIIVSQMLKFCKHSQSTHQIAHLPQ